MLPLINAGGRSDDERIIAMLLSTCFDGLAGGRGAR
jgi:hypothetical protein